MSVDAPYRCTVTVVGMSCEHCVRAVTEELEALNGVRSVEVALSSGAVTVTSDRELSGTEIAGAVGEAGYQLAE
jgi:copper chaperone CopZ